MSEVFTPLQLKAAVLKGQFEIIAGYISKIDLDKLDLETVRGMLSDDYIFLHQEFTLLEAETIFFQMENKTQGEGNLYIEVPASELPTPFEDVVVITNHNRLMVSWVKQSKDWHLPKKLIKGEQIKSWLKPYTPAPVAVPSAQTFNEKSLQVLKLLIKEQPELIEQAKKKFETLDVDGPTIYEYFNAIGGSPSAPIVDSDILKAYAVLADGNSIIDPNLLGKGLYAALIPVLYAPDTTIEDLISQYEEMIKITGHEVLPKSYLENLSKCQIKQVKLKYTWS